MVGEEGTGGRALFEGEGGRGSDIVAIVREDLLFVLIRFSRGNAGI
jgi:hypothetical protein